MQQDPRQNVPQRVFGEVSDQPVERRVARPAMPGDIPAIQTILFKAGLSALGASLQSDSPAERAFYVCEIDGVIVAAIHWQAIPPEAEILDVAVSTEHRRRGHATFLLREFLRHATASGIHKFLLEVRESNSAALALSKNVAFSIAGRRPRYYRNPDEDALLLQLVLSG